MTTEETLRPRRQRTEPGRGAKGNGVRQRIVVVDDDEAICEMIQDYMSDEGFAVATALDGVGLHAAIAEAPTQLVILDLKLPDKDGFALARELRERHADIGILILTGKDDVVDRVAGLEIGADDYVTKPFHLRELLARARSILRRRQQDAAAEDPVDPAPHPAGDGGRRRFRFAGWTIDLTVRELRAPDGCSVVLTGGEFDLLVTFVEHPGRPLSRAQILDMARHRAAAPFDRSIDVQVGRLRRKIETDPKRPMLIKTIRNAGYMLDAPVNRA
jgi:DNA-binding response OmpR family regulator